MENAFEQIANDTEYSEEKKRDLASGVVVSALATIGGLFELGADIKVDNDNRSICITGYDNLDEEYNMQHDSMGESLALRQRENDAEISITDDVGCDSDFPEVMDEIERDNKRLKTVPSNLLKP